MKKWKLFFTLITLMLLFGSDYALQETQAAVIQKDQVSKLIWFGDSRTVFFGETVYGYKPRKGVYPQTILRRHVVARRTSMHGWANGTGYKELAKRLKKHPDAVVIFNFGVNDIGRGYDHKNSYRRLLHRIHKKFPQVQLYFMSVNPVSASSRNPYAKTSWKARQVNQKIAAFNSYMKKHLPRGYGYINTYKKVKFRYKDGLHYTGQTYRNIACYVTGKKKLK